MAAIHSKIVDYVIIETGGIFLSYLKQLAYSFMITKTVLYICPQKIDTYSKICSLFKQ